MTTSEIERTLIAPAASNREQLELRVLAGVLTDSDRVAFSEASGALGIIETTPCREILQACLWLSRNGQDPLDLELIGRRTGLSLLALLEIYKGSRVEDSSQHLGIYGFRAALRDLRALVQRDVMLEGATAMAKAAKPEEALSILEDVRHRLACVSEKQGVLESRAVSAEALLSKPPPTPPQLLEGALYQGGTMLLAGPSKAHKTWSMLDLGLCVASGLPWMGFNTKQAPVVYLNLELPDFVAKDRLRAIALMRGVEVPRDLCMVNLRGKTVDIAQLEGELPEMIKSRGAGMVVIDPHYKISAVSGFEENSNDGQGQLLARLEALCSGNGAALVVAHHFAKGAASEKNAIDRASGGGVFARWPDLFATLTPHEEEDAMTLEMVLRAMPPVPPRALRWKYPVWVDAKDLDPTKLKRAGRTDQHPASEALAKLRDGMTNKEWQDALGWSGGSFRRKRDALIKQDKVYHTAGGWYAR